MSKVLKCPKHNYYYFEFEVCWDCATEELKLDNDNFIGIKFKR